MSTLYLTPTAISDLALLLLAGLITGYLFYLAWHTREKRPYQILFLAFAFAFTSSYILLDFLNQTLYPDHSYLFLPWQSVAMTIGMVCLTQFAYRMPALHTEWRRESAFVFGLTALLPLWEIWFATRRYANLIDGIIQYRPSNVDFILTAVFLWMIIIYLRQMVKANERNLPLWRKLWQPPNRRARTARRFALISLMPVGLTAVLILQSKTNVSTTAASLVLSMGLLFTMLVFALVYLNYLSEHTSFMLRLSIITLSFFLGILGTVAQIMTPSFVASYDNHTLITPSQTLRFTPNTQGGYDISQTADDDTFDDTKMGSAWGEKLTYDSEQTALSLPFAFPFYDQQWTELFVLWNGGVQFERPLSSIIDSLFRYGSAPSISLIRASLSTNLPDDGAGDGLYVQKAAEQVTLTWLNIPEKDTPSHHYTFQLRLHADGVFEMTFVELPPLSQYSIETRWHTARMLGALPNVKCDNILECTVPPAPQFIRFNTDLPISSGANGVIEDYHRDFRIALHTFLTPLFWLTLFSALLVPVGLSLVLKHNLVTPLHNLLEGVNQMDSGNLSINIPIKVEDEFGYLTHAFNRMASELNAHVHELEGRVAERTAELADTTAYLDNILNAAKYAIITIDHQLHITYFNTTAELLYNAAASEVLGKPLSAIPAWDIDSDRFDASLQYARTHGTYDYVRLQKTAVGSRHISASISGIYNQTGELIGYAYFSQDISGRLEIEAHLLTQQRALSALEERERIGRELHDGIGQVMGYLNLQIQASCALLTDGRQGAATKLLDQLVNVTQKSHNDVREFILGIQKPIKTPTNFWAALHLLAETFEAQRNISILLSLPADEPLWLPPSHDLHLLRIIQEALTNIYKHASATHIQIIATKIAPDKAQFIVSDNGCGFDTAAKETDLDNASPQPHFGLNIMRERAIELNGRLEIRSTPGQGTQVLITITIEPDKKKPLAPLAPLRVLLVDDHPLFREGLANLLQVYGITIVGTASNGLEAQTLTRQTHPDLIVMDIEMPICDGIEATRRIKAEFPDQRIIMLTVSATDDTLFAALKAGASGYLLKNMSTEELFMLIAGLGDGASPIAPELAGKVIAEFQRITRPESTLNARQEQILQLVANGRSYHEIAAELYISERTVKRQMKQIMDTLHLQSRAETEAYARSHLS